MISIFGKNGMLEALVYVHTSSTAKYANVPRWLRCVPVLPNVPEQASADRDGPDAQTSGARRQSNAITKIYVVYYYRTLLYKFSNITWRIRKDNKMIRSNLVLSRF